MRKGKREAARTRNKTDIVLMLLGAFLALFIVTMIVTFWVKDSVPDTLIQMVLGAGSLEAWLLERIKVNKIKNGADAGNSGGIV